MLRLHGRVSASLITRVGLRLAGWVVLWMVYTPLAQCLPPSVVFNGVAAVLDTGSAALNHPKGVAVDSAGNVYIADTAHNQIVKVTPSGDASALSITGLSTALSAPEGLALDGSGNLYVADTGNNRIVMVTSASAGSVVDLGAVSLTSPRGVAVDAEGNLYVADTGNNRIVKLPSGGSAAVLSITGLGTALSAPAGLGVDVAGNLYIADAGNNRMVKVTTGGAGSAVSISGLGTALSAPAAVAVDGFSNLYIADAGNNRVVKVDSGGNGSVPSAGSLTFNTPEAVAVDVSGQIYLADTANSRIAVLMTSAVAFGELSVGASSPRSFTLPFTVGVAATLGSVQALTLGAQSLDFTLGADTTCANSTTNTTCDVEVQFLPMTAGLRRGAVALFDQSSTLLAVVPIYGTGAAPLAALSPGTASVISTGGVSLGSPFQAAIDGAGNAYVSSYSGSKVVKIAAGGGSASVVSTGAFTLNEAAGVALDGAGNLYIADYGNSRIVLVKSTGAASVFTISGLSQSIGYPTALAMDGAGNLYIADYGNGRIVKVTPAGVGSVVATGSYTFSSTTLTGVAVDPSGNVYIADRSADHIVKAAPSGAASLVTLAGLTLTSPQGVAADGNGNLYIADSGQRRVVQVTAAGDASVVQTPGQTIGTFLFGVTPDNNGNLFIPDWSGNRLIQVNQAGAALAFADTPLGQTSSDSPKTATVTNLGNQALAFSADPSYTADFPENPSDASLCTASTSLEPGELCDVSVSFTPQSTGSLSADVAVTNNHLNGSDVTQTIALSGTGTQLTPSITLESSANPAMLSDSVTFTATLSSPDLTPTGSVDFYDGTTLLGTETLASGVATYSTSSLATGDHSITAEYSADSNFLAVTSSVLSQMVSGLSLAVASGGTSSATVAAGGTATYQLTIAPSGGSLLPAVTFSATGQPTGSTVTFTPSSIAAGSAATDVTVTVQVPASRAAARASIGWALAAVLPLIGVLALPVGIRGRRLPLKRGFLATLPLIAVILTAALLACGDSARPPAPPAPQATDYTITVTATSGSVSQSTTLTLTVQ